MTVVSFLIIPGTEPPTEGMNHPRFALVITTVVQRRHLAGGSAWDTSSSQGRLLSTLLAAIADFERDLIRERTAEGRKRAMAAGIKFGRPRKLSSYQRQEAIKRRADGETLAAISKSDGVSIAMISRL